MSDFPRHIVFFDGYCHLCHRTVLWLMPRTKEILFAPLSGITFQAIQKEFPAPTPLPNSILAWTGAEWLTESAAIKWIMKDMSKPYQIARKIAQIPPNGLLDSLYRIIARNRHRWFGASSTCLVPNGKEISKRLLP